MKKKILVVEDDPVQKELYVEVFRNKGYEIISAKDGVEGLNLALREKPDLVVTAVLLPGMSGIELIQNLRANVATTKLPIIMLSHLGRYEDKEKAEKLSNVTFLVKSVDGPAETLAKIEDILHGAES